MAPNTPPTAAITCAESIAFLYLLHLVPDQPSFNAVANLHIRATGYTLSFK